MVIKFNPDPSPFTPGEWFEYFFKFKKKNTTQTRILNDTFKNLELNYPFLDETQHWGKVYQLLGIPQTCGKINRAKLKELYQLEKKLHPRISKLNIDIKQIKRKNDKDYRQIVKKTRYNSNEQLLIDQEKELSNQKVKNFQTNKYGIFDMDSNNCESEMQVKKRVRFKNVQILCYDKTSSSSELDVSSTTASDHFDQQNDNTNKGNIHKPYFERLNDSINSNESVKGSDGNNNNEEIISLSDQTESEILSKDIANNEITIGSDEEENSITAIGVTGNLIAPIIDHRNDDDDYDKDEELSDNSVDNDTGVMSPFPFTAEDDEEDESYSDTAGDGNDTGMISPMASLEEESQRTEFQITCLDPNQYSSHKDNEKELEHGLNTYSAEESNTSDQLIISESGQKLHSPISKTNSDNEKSPVEANIENHIPLSPKARITALNSETDVPPMNYDSLCSNFTDLNVANLAKTDNSIKKVCCDGQERDDMIYKDTCSSSINSPSSLIVEQSETNTLTTNIPSSLQLHSSSESSDMDVDDLLYFIPSGNLVHPKIDQLDDYRLSSSSNFSDENSRTSAIEQELGFCGIPGNRKEVRELVSFINDENTVDNISVKGINKLSNEMKQSRLKLQRNKEEIISSKSDSGDILSGSNKESQNILTKDVHTNNDEKINVMEKVIRNSESSNSENIVQTSFKSDISSRREPLKLISINPLSKRKSISRDNKAPTNKNNVINTMSTGKENKIPNFTDQESVIDTVSPRNCRFSEDESASSDIVDDSFTTDRLNDIEDTNKSLSCEEDILPCSCESDDGDNGTKLVLSGRKIQTLVAATNTNKMSLDKGDQEVIRSSGQELINKVKEVEVSHEYKATSKINPIDNALDDNSINIDATVKHSLTVGDHFIKQNDINCFKGKKQKDERKTKNVLSNITNKIKITSPSKTNRNLTEGKESSKCTVSKKAVLQTKEVPVNRITSCTKAQLINRYDLMKDQDFLIKQYNEEVKNVRTGENKTIGDINIKQKLERSKTKKEASVCKVIIESGTITVSDNHGRCSSVPASSQHHLIATKEYDQIDRSKSGTADVGLTAYRQNKKPSKILAMASKTAITSSTLVGTANKNSSITRQIKVGRAYPNEPDRSNTFKTHIVSVRVDNDFARKEYLEEEEYENEAALIANERENDTFKNIRNREGTTSNAEDYQSYRRKVTLTKKKIISTNDDDDITLDKTIKSPKRNVKSIKRKHATLTRLENYISSKSSETSSDDMEMIRSLQSDKDTLDRLPVKKTNTTNRMIINQTAESIGMEQTPNCAQRNEYNSNYEQHEFSGGQSSQGHLKLRKTSIVKQQIDQSSDISTTATSEFITSSLARRIFYLNT